MVWKAASARFFFWRDERANVPYDIWVIILAFVGLRRRTG